MENKTQAIDKVEEAISDTVKIPIALDKKTKNRAEFIIKHKGMKKVGVRQMLTEVVQKYIDTEFEKIRDEL